MRFLVDAQLPPALAKFLEKHGHEAKAAREVGVTGLRPVYFMAASSAVKSSRVRILASAKGSSPASSFLSRAFCAR